MHLFLSFAVVLVVAVLLSEFFERSVLSTAVLFLIAGFVLGPGALGAFTLPRGVVLPLASVALFTSLFVDGMHAPRSLLVDAWRLPTRALLVGMPLTFVGTSLLAYAMTGRTWVESFLVGAVLTPTDPVFAAAIVGRRHIPLRLRHLLNVESGLNDGLALPVVLVLLSAVSSSKTSIGKVCWELALGVAIGVVVPMAVLALERTRVFGTGRRYDQLSALSIGVLVFALCQVSSANPYLAAFAAGSAVASRSPQSRDRFEGLGEALSELTKVAAIFVFGALVTPALLGRVSIGAWVWAALLLVVVRPLSLLFALVGERVDRKEWASAAWFGPKGFASVTYGLLVLQSSAVHATAMFDLIAIVVGVSILAHSSTDTIVARAFEEP